MKVKTFGKYFDSIPSIENDINNFIKDKSVIDIKYCVDDGMEYVLVMYVELDKKCEEQK